MTTDHTTQAEATPPIPAPAFLPGAQVWQTAFGAWVLHDAKNQTSGALRQLVDGWGWVLHHPISEEEFSASLTHATLAAVAMLRDAAKEAKNH